MNKVLRIFAKDTRHLWPEIVLSLALTFGFAATAHATWPQFRTDINPLQAVYYWTFWLMPISWWLLIARSVHDESLVGDRQFWVTRPYGWPRVLGAKLLFIAAYILTPYLLAQVSLLHQAGLHPLLVVPGLVYSLGCVFFLLIMPLFALAVVTANTTRMFIIFFALFVYVALVAYFSTVLGNPAPWQPQVSHPEAWVLLAIPVFTVAVTFLQYSTRRTDVSRLLLIALVLILTAGGLAAAYRPNNTGRDFPALAANETSPVTISLNPDPRLQYEIATNPNVQPILRGEARSSMTRVPLLLTGMASDHAVSFEGETYTVSGDGIGSETVAWQRGQMTPLMGSNPSLLPLNGGFPATNGAPYALVVPSWIVEKSASKAAILHIKFAVNELVAEPAKTVVFDGVNADVPENGHCVLSAHAGPSVTCQYALAGPGLTHVTWTMRQACDRPGSQILNKEEWIGDTERLPREIDLSPVISQSTSFPITDSVNEAPPEYHLCSGTSFTLTRYHVSRRRLEEVTLPPIDLRLYVSPVGNESFRPN